MRSMTGFGAGSAPIGGGRLTLEIRAMNHRFLDVRVRLPYALADLGSFVEGIARERLSRGRFDVTVHFDGAALGVAALDKERARAAFRAFEELRDELAPNQDVPLALLAHVPGIFVAPLERQMDAARTALHGAFESAAIALDQMRAREGAALSMDLEARLAAVRTRVANIAARAPELTVAHKKRLLDRFARLGIGDELGADPGRVEQEIALFAERVDVSEELTRIESHLAQATVLLGMSEPIGRRLDFLLQEMAREVNTVGSKSPDVKVSHAVVEVKAEIERMREQVQNVE